MHLQHTPRAPHAHLANAVFFWTIVRNAELGVKMCFRHFRTFRSASRSE